MEVPQSCDISPRPAFAYGSPPYRERQAPHFTLDGIDGIDGRRFSGGEADAEAEAEADTDIDCVVMVVGACMTLVAMSTLTLFEAARGQSAWVKRGNRRNMPPRH